MDIGIRIDNLRKVYTSSPPAATPARGGPMGGQRIFSRREKKKVSVVALDGISFEVRAGEIFGLLGPNGAGKSTTVGILTTRVRPTEGQAWIGGHEVWRDRVAVKRFIGVVPQKPNLDFALTAREILTYHAAYFGQVAVERERRAAELLDRFKLTDRADQMVHGFSGGIQALIAGGVIIPTAWLVLGSGVQISFAQPLELIALALFVATLAAAIGLTLGCSLGQAQIGIMFSLIIGPMIFFGCTYYPWTALAPFPILQTAVLVNPFVYASEGFRSALAPQFPHLPGYLVFGGLLVFNALFLWLGLRQFRKRAIG